MLGMYENRIGNRMITGSLLNLTLQLIGNRKWMKVSLVNDIVIKLGQGFRELKSFGWIIPVRKVLGFWGHFMVKLEYKKICLG